MMQPDSVLCKLCARGSDDAFAVLYSRYRQQVFAFIFHLLDRPSAKEDAEDITQEVFSKAYTAMHSKQQDGSFKHWLFTIARNRTFDTIRALKPNAIQIDTTEDAVQMPTTGRSASSEAEAKQELAWLVGTVSGLPERQREALVMRELAGMSHAQIADALETSVPATKQLISRGRDSVHDAARENGYQSRRLGRELAMAAPILPFVAFNFGAATASASAATTSAGVATGAVGATSAATGVSAAGTSAAATGFGGLALGTKVAATILTVAAVGGGTVVAERAVTGESPESTSVLTGGSGKGAGNGSGTNSATNNGLTPAEAQEPAAEKKRAARAKAKRAKQRAKAKRERAAMRAKQKRLNAKKNALRRQNARNGTDRAASGGSQSGGSSERAASGGEGAGGKETSPAPAKPETAKPPANSNGGSGQGNSGDKGKP